MQTTRPLSAIAADIRKAWRDKQGKPCVNYAAKPYLEAMADLDGIDDRYGADSARSVVAYFLGNASTFRGEQAKALKAELKGML